MLFCVVNAQPGDRSRVVYERGCLRAGEEWVEVNLIPVAGAAVGIAILQVFFHPVLLKISLCFSWKLTSEW